MNTEQLIHHQGKPVTVYLNEDFDEARATLKAWSSDFRSAYVQLNSQYGKRWKEGMTIQVPAYAVMPAKRKK